MARRASVAQGGFFPTPPHLLPGIAAILRPTWPAVKPYHHDPICRVVDPCAGEGAALAALRLGMAPPGKPGLVEVYGCEMEQGRAEALHAVVGPSDRVAKGDFFHLRFEPKMADVLYLNPPYDTDRKYRRLEARFLDMATPILTPGGVLVFVIPFYALGACAAIFARHYENPRAFRFPGKDFDVYKQIVVFAARTVRTAPEPSISTWCEQVSRDCSALPELPVVPARTEPRTVEGIQAQADRLAAEAALPAYAAPLRDARGWSHSETWEIVGFDLGAVASLDPWASDRGPIVDLAHPHDLVERASAVYPVAQPPRPIHLASALAAGVFNGLRVVPNDGASGLPPLLVKGTFARRWETVDTKRDEDGDLKSETQAERPELEVWVLDLTRGTYHLIASSPVLTPALRTIDGATFADLLTHYSRDLLAALRAACPVLHDPWRGDPEPMVDTGGRPLWRAQNSVLHATAKVLDAHGGAIIVGEVGTGKTGISATLTRLRDSRRALVQAPPHLLSSWRAQIAAVLPGVDVVTLESVSDVDALRAHPGPVIALLSREAGKLGHGWRDMGPLRTEARPEPARRLSIACPRCGAEVRSERLSERRQRCTAPRLAPTPSGAGPVIGAWLRRHLLLLLRVRPSHSGLVALASPTRAMERWHHWASKAPHAALLDRLDDALIELCDALRAHPEARDALIYRLAWARPAIVRPALAVLPRWKRGEPEALFKTRQALMLALDPSESVEFEEHPEESRSWDPKPRFAAWKEWTNLRASVHKTWTTSDPGLPWSWGHGHKGSGMGFGTGTLWGAERASDKALDDAITQVLIAASMEARWPRPSKGHKPRPPALCNEPLFQAEPRPRRYPLGAYIARRAGDLFDTLIFDEAHELSSDSAAQGIMFMRLAQMAHKSGAAVLCLTGSIANGYAASLFNALWAVSPEFRAAFKWGDREKFIDAYGLRKRVILHGGKDGTAITVSRGATSERVIGKIKPAGCTPGVIPTLLLDHLLKVATIIHKADLDRNLPALTEACPTLPLPAEVEERLTKLMMAVKDAIAKTRFEKELAGRCFGMLAQLLSYPDLAAVGNEPDGSFALRWPASVPTMIVKDLHIAPGAVLVSVPPLPDIELPKERWMLDTVKAALTAGRGALVLPTHRVLLARYQRLLEEAGILAALLDAQKVEAAKREAWIDKHLYGRRAARVLIANPICIQTGLNNLVCLQDALWMENPNCNPIVDEQGNGRLHRPGQEQDVRVLRPVYDHPLTRAGFRLLMHKVGVVRAVNGLSPEAVYAAAGIGDELTAGLSVGQELYKMLVDGASD